MIRHRNIHTSVLDVATKVMMVTEGKPKGPKPSGQVIVIVMIAFPGNEINRDIVVAFTTGPNTPHRRMVVAWGHGTAKKASSMRPGEFDGRSGVRVRAGPHSG